MTVEDWEEYRALRQTIMQEPHMQTTPDWVKGYLTGGGSLLEYYQLYKCMQFVSSHEEQTSTRYDYVVRTRCDTVLLHPLQSIATLFKHRYGNLQDYMLSGPPLNLAIIPLRRVYTVRKNCMWIADRDAAGSLSRMIFFYGKARPVWKSGHWWDAESQFECFMDLMGLEYAGHHDELLDLYMRSRSKNASVIDRNTSTLNPNLPRELIFTLHRPADYAQFSED
jgi:hypothetical protein